ncbi:MAG: YCF48-related protein [Bacteroidia bacterium]
MKKAHLLLITMFMVCFNALYSQTWVNQNTPGNVDPKYCIQFISPTTGWLGGMAGTLFHTTDGGTTWTEQDAGTSAWFDDMHFINDTIGFLAAGIQQGGLILSTTDGGITWDIDTFPGISLIKSVYFVNDSIGWASGSNGKILKTIDRGTNWVLHNTPVTAELQKIYFTDINYGWAVGESGTIIKTIDGGINWTEENSTATGWLSEVFFTDRLKGWASGFEGTMLHTTDGGTTWLIQNTPATGHIEGLHFINSDIGWACAGGPGKIMYTIDGGINWNTFSASWDGLYDIFFYDLNNGWAVGWDLVLHTTQGGLISSLEEMNDGADNYSIYPVPSSGQLTVKSTTPILEATIMTVNGKKIYHQTFENSGLDNIGIDISGFAKGTYLLMLVDTNKAHVFKKLIIE